MGGKCIYAETTQATLADWKQTDGVTRYIDWAIEKGFGVIDVNVPHYITHLDVCFLASR